MLYRRFERQMNGTFPLACGGKLPAPQEAAGCLLRERSPNGFALPHKPHAFLAPCSVLYRLPSLMVLDLSNSLVRPAHFKLNEIKKHNFMPDEKDTYIFFGVDRDGVGACKLQF